jgi:hypothetical protein
MNAEKLTGVSTGEPSNTGWYHCQCIGPSIGKTAWETAPWGWRWVDVDAGTVSHFVPSDAPIALVKINGERPAWELSRLYQFRYDAIATGAN